MYPSRPVIVMQAPERLNQSEAERFFAEMKPLLEAERPRIVLDCSEIQDMDSAGVETLLRCMEEAMKRDGDIKLAAVAPASAIVLELMRADRLFEVFNTSDEAVRSFHSVSAQAVPQEQMWIDPAAGEFEAAS
jgi:anti-sigma B factor antagonist